MTSTSRPSIDVVGDEVDPKTHTGGVQTVPYDAETTQHERPNPEFADDPSLPILWAAAWNGSAVRCLFHHSGLAGCPACSEEEDHWALLHRTIASMAEMLNLSEKNGSTQMVVVIREREMQLTAVNADGPMLTVAIPPGPDVIAAQSWMQRWAALKFRPQD